MLPRPTILERTLSAAIVIVCFIVFGLFLVVALRRLNYPYELEQLEGFMLLSVQRVANGQTLYPPPSIHFIPYLYAPLYFYLAAAVGKVTGMGFPALRVTSILSTLGGFGMLYLIVWREVRRHLPALAAAGLYAGCYPICESWFDRGRVDSLFVLTVLIALFCTRNLHPSIAALAWTVAFLTKQTILPAAFVMLCFDFPQRKRTAVGLATLAVAAGGCFLWMQHTTQGWYSFYVFTVPGAAADLLLRQALEYWPVDLFRPLGLALAIIIAAFFFTKPSLQHRGTRFYICTLVFFPLFWFVDSHAGSSINAVMPVYALLAVLFGISFSRLCESVARHQAEAWRFAISFLLIVCLVQEAAGISNPGRFRVNPADGAAISSVIRTVRALPGEVYVVEHPYYGVLAGKEPYADFGVLDESMKPANPEVRERLHAEMEAALKQGLFSAVVLDSEQSTASLNTTLHLDPTWEARFLSPSLIPGTLRTTKPAWIMIDSAGKKTVDPATINGSQLEPPH